MLNQLPFKNGSSNNTSISGGNLGRKRWAALCASAFMMLGVAWAFASPHGSSADEDFHLVNIWCAWGDSEMCTLSPETLTATVPETIAYSWCYARWPGQISAGCLNELTDNPVVTGRISFDSLTYNLPFYSAMRTFAGTDVAFSVQVMRIVNVLIASLLFFWALTAANWRLSRALALTWGVAMIPVGIFFIASVNPSSWTIMGVGTFWVFLGSLLSSAPKSRGRTLSLLLGLLTSALIALTSRTDAGVYLILSIIAISIWRWRFIKSHLPKKVGIPLAAITVTGTGILLFIWSRKWNGFGLSSPGAQTAMDQPNPALKTLLEVPAFIFGLFGGQSARTVLRDSDYAMGLDGYRPVGFIQGLGWTETQMPSLVGIMIGAAVMALMLAGWRRYEKSRAIAFILLVIAFVAQILFIRAQFDFSAALLIQPRYLFPPTLVIIGVALALKGPEPFLNRFQAAALTSVLAVAGSIAWLATSSRYAIGPQATYINFGQPVEWWWPAGPGRLSSFIIAAIITLSWAIMSIFAVSTTDNSNSTAASSGTQVSPTRRRADPHNWRAERKG